MKKVIIAQFSIHNNKIEEFLNLTKTLVAKSNSEKGCLTYKLLKEADVNNSFFVYEEYESQKAIEEHSSSEHFKTFLNLVTPLLLKEPIIDIFDNPK